jgi:hypothetical protein
MSNSCLENIDNLSELNYVFNKEKISNPKQFMKEVFEQNKTEIFNAVNSNSMLKESLNVDSIDDLTVEKIVEIIDVFVL